MTFDDGVKGTLIGSGFLKVPGITKLETVLLVNGLKVNLINISQLCEHNLFVNLAKNKCSLVDSSNTCVVEGERSLDNCYLLACLGNYYTISLTNTDIRH